MLHALLKSPWYVNEKVLSLEKWDPEFDPKAKFAKQVPLWVQIQDLPLHLWDKDIFRGIANSFRQLMAIDLATANKTQFIHTKFCVLVKSDMI